MYNMFDRLVDEPGYSSFSELTVKLDSLSSGDICQWPALKTVDTWTSFACIGLIVTLQFVGHCLMAFISSLASWIDKLHYT